MKKRMQRPLNSRVSTAVALCLGASLVTIICCARKPEQQSASKEASSAAESLNREAWRKTMEQTPMPNKKGCFSTEYPKTAWQEVPCTTPPSRPYPPRHGNRRADIVGNGSDFSAEVTDTISSATGSFDSVVGVTNESGNVNGNPPTVANTFSLQLNAKPFVTSLCSGSPNPSCLGWQQFVYSNSGFAFVQYWLLEYNTRAQRDGHRTHFPDQRIYIAIRTPQTALLFLSRRSRA
jgi:hypothetical protein